METKGDFEKPAGKTGGTDWKEREEIFSRYVNAGRRRYFFDVKATRADDYYLVITESTRRYNDDGTDRYDRHRLFLYKEDFNKFSDRMAEVMDFIKRERGEAPIRHAPEAKQPSDLPTEPALQAEPTETTEKSTIDEPSSDGKEESTDTTGKSSEFTDVKFEDLGDTSEEKEEIPEKKEEEDASSDLPPESKAKEEDSSPELDQPSAEEEEEEKGKEEETEKAEKE